MCSPDDYLHLMPGDRAITKAVRRALERSTSETEREAILQGPAPYDVQVARAVARGDAHRAERSAILVAADALGLDDCPMGCSCRGGAL